MNSKRKAYAGGFNDDTSMEILLRLPVKCVIRFQIVSKKWLSLISSDHFRREHNLRHDKPPACRIFTKLGPSLCYFDTATNRPPIITLSVNIPGNIIPPTILTCCNGLLLLYRCPDFHVYNPITRQSRKIILPRTVTYNDLCRLHLVFDIPSKSPHYKIVYLRPERKPTSGGHSHTSIEVFSSESGSWKACMEPISFPLEFCFGASVCCNNKIYGTKRYDGGSLYCIDIDKNVLTFLASPPTIRMRTSYIHSIQEWNGYLYYSAIYRDNDSGRHLAYLWEKDKDNDKWLSKYEDTLPLLFDSVMLISFVVQTSALLILVRPRKFMAYSFLDKSCNELLHLDILNLSWEEDYGSMHLFHQTLAPV